MKESSGIYIDKDGVWYYQGQEMIRKDIVKYFSSHLQLAHSGRYIIAIDGEQADVQVEDCPLVVRNLSIFLSEASAESKIELYLSDGSTEIFEPESLRIGENNIPYCRVRDNTLDARFSRAAYYAISALIEEGRGGQFFFLFNGRKYCLQNKSIS